MLRNVCCCELIGGLAENASDVHRHITHADNRNVFLTEVKLQICKIRMAVVPSDKFRR